MCNLKEAKVESTDVKCKVRDFKKILKKKIIVKCNLFIILDTKDLASFPSEARAAVVQLDPRDTHTHTHSHQLTDQAVCSQSQLEGLCFTQSGPLCRDVALCWRGTSSVTGWNVKARGRITHTCICPGPLCWPLGQSSHMRGSYCHAVEGRQPEVSTLWKQITETTIIFSLPYNYLHNWNSFLVERCGEVQQWLTTTYSKPLQSIGFHPGWGTK